MNVLVKDWEAYLNRTKFKEVLQNLDVLFKSKYKDSLKSKPMSLAIETIKGNLDYLNAAKRSLKLLFLYVDGIDPKHVGKTIPESSLYVRDEKEYRGLEYDGKYEGVGINWVLQQKRKYLDVLKGQIYSFKYMIANSERDLIKYERKLTEDTTTHRPISVERIEKFKKKIGEKQLFLPKFRVELKKNKLVYKEGYSKLLDFIDKHFHNYKDLRVLNERINEEIISYGPLVKQTFGETTTQKKEVNPLEASELIFVKGGQVENMFETIAIKKDSELIPQIDNAITNINIPPNIKNITVEYRGLDEDLLKKATNAKTPIDDYVLMLYLLRKFEGVLSEPRFVINLAIEKYLEKREFVNNHLDVSELRGNTGWVTFLKKWIKVDCAKDVYAYIKKGKLLNRLF